MKILKTILDLICGDPPQPVDVAAYLDGLAAEYSEKLDWRHSIVDLLKLLAMDSSLGARRQLAHELGVDGDVGTPAVNQAMHRALMKKLRENGGKLPDELRA